MEERYFVYTEIPISSQPYGKTRTRHCTVRLGKDNEQHIFFKSNALVRKQKH